MTVVHEADLSPAAAAFVREARARGGTTSTQEAYARALYMLERRLDRPLLEATREHLLELAAMLARERSGRNRAAIARMFYKSKDRDDLAKALRIRGRAQGRKLRAEDVLDEGDVSKLLEACVSLRDRVLVSVLWDLGARVNDVVAINLEDLNEVVSEENGGEHYYRVNLRIRKTKDETSVLLIDSAPYIAEWLERYPGPKKPGAPLIWSWVNGRLTDSGAWTLLRKIARTAGVRKPVNPHAFRHGRATSYLRQGMSEAQVKRLMGWKPNSTMLGRYSHLVDADAEEAKLRATGRKPPKRPVPGGLIKPEILKPVVAVQPPAGRPAPPMPLERDDVLGAAFPGVNVETLARAIAKAQLLELAAMPAAAWHVNPTIERLEARVRELEAKLGK